MSPPDAGRPRGGDPGTGSGTSSTWAGPPQITPAAGWWDRPDAVPERFHRDGKVRDLSGDAARSVRERATRLGPTAHRRVFDAVVELTVGYGWLWDRLHTQRIARSAGLRGKTAPKQARQALKRLDREGVIVYRPARGQGYRSVVGIGPAILEREADRLPLTKDGREADHLPFEDLKGRQIASPEREADHLPRKGGDSPPPPCNEALLRPSPSSPLALTHEPRSEPTGEGRDAPHRGRTTTPDLAGTQLEVERRICERIGWPGLRDKPRKDLAEIVLVDDPPEPYLKFLGEKSLKKNWINQALDACREVREMLDRRGRDSYRPRQQTVEDLADPLAAGCQGPERNPSAAVDWCAECGTRCTASSCPAAGLESIPAPAAPVVRDGPEALPGAPFGAPDGAAAPTAAEQEQTTTIPVRSQAPEWVQRKLAGVLPGAAKDAPGGDAAPTAVELEQRKDESVRLAESLAAGQPPEAVLAALKARHPDPAELGEVFERLRQADIDLSIDSPAPVCPSPATNGAELIPLPPPARDGSDGRVGLLIEAVADSGSLS